MGDKPTPSYRWAAWSHWANLAFLAATGALGATVDPSFWLLALPVEALAVWVVPDLPPFRARIDEQGEREALIAERAYYLEQLWGLRPRSQSFGERVRGLFVAREVDDYDQRIDRRTQDCERYLEMRTILRKLREMVPLARTRVTERDVRMLERVVNGYLRLLVACRPLARAVNELEQAGLGPELAKVHERLEGADPTLRPVLLERKRLLEAQLARAPKLRATLELLRARAEALPHQLRNLHAQLLAEPGAEVHGALEEMLERNELLADPLADLRADEAVRELLQSSTRETGARARPAKQGAAR